jgi:hypothetical protein
MRHNAIVACQSKKVYDTQEEADRTLEYLWVTKEVDVYSYKCNICEMYHLSGKKEK